ncbi:MAG TPA: hypothetical protein VII96_02670 [Acidimicrobiales bacterium]
MKKVATCRRNERPVDDEGAVIVLHDDGPWGFRAVDGLPDLEAASPYRRTHSEDQFILSTGAAAAGFDDEVKEQVAGIGQRARDLQTRQADAVGGGSPALSAYEVELCYALTARRDSAVQLQQILADDVAQYDCGMAGVRAGLAVDLLVPGVGGSARRSMSDALSEFESARHRFRMALVAVALDNGMTAVQIGQAFAFSRQLASRYLKEARDRWPELAERNPPRRRAG